MMTQQRRVIFVAMASLCLGVASECHAGRWDAWFDLLRGGARSAGKVSNAEQVAEILGKGAMRAGKAAHRPSDQSEPLSRPEATPPQPVDWEARENSYRNTLLTLACLCFGGVAYLFYWNSQLVKRQGR